MTANQVFLLILIISVVALLALYAATIKSGLKWAGVANISMFKTLGLFFVFLFMAVVAIIFLANVFAFAFGKPNHSAISASLTYLVAAGAELVAIAFVVSRIYKVRFLRAARAVLPYEIVLCSMGFLNWFVIRP
jgi:hypothetical protein